jgi:hypothetical protein
MRSILYCVVLCLPAVFWTGIRIYNAVVFNIHCTGHLKLASDANTVEMAQKELAIAIKYLEDHNMTEGYTSVLWKTPSEDVGFWYQNLKAAHAELGKVNSETTQLERTNVLMKLRETLLDHGKNGDTVTAPDGISVFPNNTGVFVSGWIVFIMAGIGVILLFKDCDFKDEV